MAYHKVIGIDLGTTYSAVAVWDHEKGQVEIIPSAMGGATVPSVVGLDPTGQVIVGAPAQNNLASDPLNTVIEVKREMGMYEREPNLQTEDPGDVKKMPFRGRDYLPQEISAFILMELKRQAEAFIGEPIHDAVITEPAYFKEPQKGATQDAGNMARLNVKRLLNEPTAAAVAFGVDKAEEGEHCYAVYDLGGGTFDVSIIQVSPEEVTVVGTGGDPRLGGGDFDDRITQWALDQIKAAHGVDLSSDRAVGQRIKREAEGRKRELATAAAATLNLPFLTADLSVNIPITRATFESLIEELLQHSLDCLDEAVESAYQANAVKRDDIEQVLLVGGSTRIPRIRSMLAEHLGLEEKDIRSDINPDEVVARGAALVALEFKPSTAYEGEEVEIEVGEYEVGAAQAPPPKVGTVQDVTGHTLGILANEADFIPIIMKDSQIPTRETQGGFTNAGPTNEIRVLIFQGEDPIAFNNTLIGKLPIELPEPKEQGYYKFEVTFGLDANSLLSVTTGCLNVGMEQEWKTELQCDVRSTREQIDASAEHLQEAMASGEAAVSGLPIPPPSSAPEPGPQPAAPSPAEAASAAAGAVAVAEIPPPPAETPDEFKAIARRSHRLLGQLDPSDQRDRLLSAYMAFVRAVESGSPDVEELGDELDDTFRKSR